MAISNWPQLYAESLADVSDVAEEIGKAQGGYYDICKAVATTASKWIGVPWCVGGGLVANRKSWLARGRVTPEKFPATWDEYRAAGKKLKAAGHPLRPDRRRTPSATRRAGGTRICGRGAARRSRPTARPSCSTARRRSNRSSSPSPLWKETMDEGGLAWDDTSNNRAFLSGTISATNNGASIYIEAKKKPDTYLTETASR